MAITLDDRYTATHGRIRLTGIQAPTGGARNGISRPFAGTECHSAEPQRR
jgi:hypothetical protein